MVSIINYGLGNLGSIVNMLQYLGIPTQVIDRPENLETAEKIILPGVGAFDAGMTNLEAAGWIPVLEHKVLNQRVPIMGICLGMQLMGASSEEGVKKGLGWLDARSERIIAPPGSVFRVPHMGWANVKEHQSDVFVSPMPEERRFYFAHAYVVKLNDPECLWLSANYVSEFCAAFRKGNIMGVQFHPEKSHKYGLDLFKKFYFEFAN